MNNASLIEKVERIKKGYRLLILFGTLFLMIIAFAFLVFKPKHEKIAKAEKEVARLEQKINQAKIKTKNLAKFEAEQAQVNIQFQEALRLLPNKREIPSLLRSITQLGADSSLEFLLFDPARERAQDFYIEIPVSIEVAGTYHEVAVFFDKVGRMERIVNILDVSMKPVKDRSTNLRTKCNAVTYRFKGKADEQADAKAAKKK